jgi:hypothetical protein
MGIPLVLLFAFSLMFIWLVVAVSLKGKRRK